MWGGSIQPSGLNAAMFATARITSLGTAWLVGVNPPLEAGTSEEPGAAHAVAVTQPLDRETNTERCQRQPSLPPASERSAANGRDMQERSPDECIG